MRERIVHVRPRGVAVYNILIGSGEEKIKKLRSAMLKAGFCVCAVGKRQVRYIVGVEGGERGIDLSKSGLIGARLWSVASHRYENEYFSVYCRWYLFTRLFGYEECWIEKVYIYL